MKLYYNAKTHIDVADILGDLYSEDRSTFELLKKVVEFLGSLDKISDIITNINMYPEATHRRCDNNTVVLQSPQQQQQNQKISKKVLTVLGRVEVWLGKLEKGQLAAGKQESRTYTETAQQAHRGLPADTEARYYKVVLVKCCSLYCTVLPKCRIRVRCGRWVGSCRREVSRSVKRFSGT